MVATIAAVRSVQPLATTISSVIRAVVSGWLRMVAMASVMLVSSLYAMIPTLQLNADAPSTSSVAGAGSVPPPRSADAAIDDGAPGLRSLSTGDR